MSQSILCPNCRFQIEVSDALSTQLREQLRKEFEAEARRKELALAKQEEALHQREQALEASRCSMDNELSARLVQEQERLQMEAKIKAEEMIALDLQDLRAQLAEAGEKLGLAQQAELQLRKERRGLEDEKQALELTVNRRLDEERAKIREEAKRDADNEHRLHEADKDKLVADLRRQIDDLKRKSEQGPQQAQGEVMEMELEDLLRSHFQFDTFEAVPVGVHGGDLLQHVCDGNGSHCGTILWESKRTKAWSDGWLPKLRDDQRAAHAHAAVLATIEMPKGLSTFACIDGVWVTSRRCLLGLATAIRAGMLEIGRIRRSAEGRQNKVDILYDYLAGSEFRQRIEGIVEVFLTLKNDLEAEKRSVQRLWAKREKQLERAALNTAGLYGDLGGILGSSLPPIANLELDTIPAAPESLAIETVAAAREDSAF